MREISLKTKSIKNSNSKKQGNCILKKEINRALEKNIEKSGEAS